ncbi:MAG: polyphosphate polymerase domain-containing protein [Clostridiales bacterium]|nr:polyphosphate polymerase domain-containing protein [Clostridiales bacterium]
MNYQDVFERYEYKYFLTPSQKRRLLEETDRRLKLDPYGRTTIRNIYYDTDSFRLIRDSLDHPVYKEKLRIRSYQRAESSDPVFIEIKKKFEGIVYKRRVAIPKSSAEHWIDKRENMPFRNQITSEIDYFLNFYEGIGARAFISYEREAYSDITNSGFRVTFDENILARDTDLDLGSDIWGEALLPVGTTLMEVKIPGAMPVWMARFLSTNNISRISYSKYGTYYKEHLMTEQYPERSVCYA